VRLKSEDERARISAALKGRVFTETHLANMSTAQVALARRGERAAAWRGDEAGYVSIHKRHRRALPLVCASLDATCRGKLEVALKHDLPPERLRVDPRSGCSFSANPADYMRLCHSHHMRYDLGDLDVSA
jgi:hypothetical protein